MTEHFLWLALLLLGAVLLLAIDALRRQWLTCWCALAAYLTLALPARLVWRNDVWVPLWLPFAYPAIWLGLTGLFWLGSSLRVSRRGIETAGHPPATLTLLLAMASLGAGLSVVLCLSAVAAILPAPVGPLLTRVELAIFSGYLFAPQFAALTGVALSLYYRRLWRGLAWLPWSLVLLPAVVITQIAGALGSLMLG